MRDDLLTNDYNAPKLRAIRQRIEPMGWPEEKVDALLFMSGGVSAAYMNNGIDALNREYGTVGGCLSQELAVGSDELDALKHRYLS